MKKIVYLSLFTVLLLVSGCNTEKKEKNDEGKSSKKEKFIKKAHKSGEVIHLTKKDFLEKVVDFESNPNEWIYKGDLPCIVDFYADWCKPCKIASPILEELAKEYKGKIYVYKVDTQVEKELAAAFGIQSIPAFLWIPMNEKAQMTNGIARTPEDTKRMFDRMIDNILLDKTIKIIE